jgi:hypothetical protein
MAGLKPRPFKQDLIRGSQRVWDDKFKGYGMTRPRMSCPGMTGSTEVAGRQYAMERDATIPFDLRDCIVMSFAIFCCGKPGLD